MYKPVILIGNGLRHNPELVSHLLTLGIPTLVTWMAADLVPEDHPAFCGRPGIYGQRAANCIQQKADSIAVFGARLDEQQIAYRYDRFGPIADKTIFDADQAELDKLPPDWKKIQTNFWNGIFSIDGLEEIDPAWLTWCKALYKRFRPELDGFGDTRFVEPFHFVYRLSEYAKPKDIIIAGAGKAGETLMQAFKVKAGQRLHTLSTNGAMGYDIPLAIGAAVASGRRVLCVTGDGGFMLNMQELELIRRLKLNIQFFVHSNNGYASIKAMQKLRFGGHIVGADPASGFTIPHLADVAECFGLEYQRIETLTQPVKFTGQLIELMVDPDYIQVPRVATTMGADGKFEQDWMQDMTPKLPADELKAIMEWDG